MNNWDQTFLGIAKIMAGNSHCVSRQVGCVFVREGRILVSGINGSAPGEENCDCHFGKDFDAVEHRAWSDRHEIHAEMNAVLFAAKHGISLEGSTLYCTLQPCDQCLKNVTVLGIERIVFAEYYSRVENNSEILERLQRANIEYSCIPFENN